MFQFRPFPDPAPFTNQNRSSFIVVGCAHLRLFCSLPYFSLSLISPDRFSTVWRSQKPRHRRIPTRPRRNWITPRPFRHLRCVYEGTHRSLLQEQGSGAKLDAMKTRIDSASLPTRALPLDSLFFLLSMSRSDRFGLSFVLR